MLPKWHLFLGFFFALTLFLVFPEIEIAGFVIIFFSTFLMDLDHYIYYVFKKRDLSLKNAYKWFCKRQKKIHSLSREQRNKVKGIFCLFHGVEVLVILFFLGFFISKYFFYVLIGFTFHLLLDIIHQKRIHDRLDRVSLTHDFLKFKKLKDIDEN